MAGDEGTAAEEGGELGTVREHPDTANPIVMAIANTLIGIHKLDWTISPPNCERTITAV